MGSQRKLLPLLFALIAPLATSAAPPFEAPDVSLLVTGLQGASGNTIGPGGALYVTEGATGTISRVDPQSGEVTTFASGLPPSIVGIGGAIDVAFIGGTAYVLVTLVGPDVGGSDVVGIYRVDGPHTFTVVADVGQNGDGSFTVVVEGLNQPTSLEFLGNTAFVVTLGGEIWRIDGVAVPPHGKAGDTAH